MNSNVGTTDRIIRTVLGIAILAFAVLSHGAIRWVGVTGAVFLVTAIVGYCPAYSIFGVKTCRVRTNIG